MSSPQIPIEVDEETGVWSTNGLPMLFMPRHFFINNHLASEKALGRDNYAAQMFAATFRSAWDWCEHEASSTGIKDIATFHHYLRRISQRGWGQFDGGGIGRTEQRGHRSAQHRSDSLCDVQESVVRRRVPRAVRVGQRRSRALASSASAVAAGPPAAILAVRRPITDAASAPNDMVCQPSDSQGLRRWLMVIS